MTVRGPERNAGRRAPGPGAGECKAPTDLRGTGNLPGQLNADLGLGKTAELGKRGRII